MIGSCKFGNELCKHLILCVCFNFQKPGSEKHWSELLWSLVLWIQESCDMWFFWLNWFKDNSSSKRNVVRGEENVVFMGCLSVVATCCQCLPAGGECLSTMATYVWLHCIQLSSCAIGRDCGIGSCSSGWWDFPASALKPVTRIQCPCFRHFQTMLAFRELRKSRRRWTAANWRSYVVLVLQRWVRSGCRSAFCTWRTLAALVLTSISTRKALHQ